MEKLKTKTINESIIFLSISVASPSPHFFFLSLLSKSSTTNPFSCFKNWVQASQNSSFLHFQRCWSLVVAVLVADLVVAILQRSQFSVMNHNDLLLVCFFKLLNKYFLRLSALLFLNASILKHHMAGRSLF
nr:uncharacterized protein LOC107435261 [Ziziphus jujuba var. spinosa]